MTATPASRQTRHTAAVRRQSNSDGKLSKTRSIVSVCLFAVLLAQQLADIHLRFVNQRAANRRRGQPCRMALSGSSQNAHTAEPATSRQAATMKGACQLP